MIMKKLLLILLAIVSLGNVLHAAEENNPVEITLQQTDDNDTKRVIDKEGQSPIRRSIQRQIAYAYIYNKVVSINFNATIEDATVTITHTATGETVHTEAYSNPTTLRIDLNGENSGSYLIEIEADGSFLTGEFSL
ncbi:MAG: DUF3244 domain-containing protein [Bacteroides sp.]|nr:DUF3244 domain-containing protein [Bacteroides sp.]